MYNSCFYRYFIIHLSLCFRWYFAVVLLNDFFFQVVLFELHGLIAGGDGPEVKFATKPKLGPSVDRS